MSTKPNEHLEALFSRYLDGQIGAEELAELERLILGDPKVADYLSEWCLIHRQIGDVLSEDRLHGLIDQYLVGRPGPPAALAGDGGRVTRAIERDSPSPIQMAAWAVGVCGVLAASVMAVLLWSEPERDGGSKSGRIAVATGHEQAEQSLVLGPQVNGRPAPGFSPISNPRLATAAAVNDAAPTPVASLTQLFDAVWADPDSALIHGQVLSTGERVALASGHAKVAFDCGAEIVLEGPCEFELLSDMAGLLHSGRITADIPRRAFGFGILCPSVDLVDLGTSFGVNVGDNGATQLHVFEGEVLCSPIQPAEAGSESLIHVRENEAKEFDAVGGGPGDIAIDKLQFASLRSRRRTRDDALHHVTTDQLALWLAADKEVMTDREGRVVNWPDILLGDNISAEDALQSDPDARPLLVADAFGRLPGVRFDGDSDFLLTTPLETTDDQTVAIVCQFSASALDEGRIWGGQILNYDGPPSRYLSNTLEPGVLQIGEPLLESQFRPTLITGQVFAGFVGALTVEAGRVDAHPVGVGRPTLVTYTYSYSAGRSELRINGSSAGVSRAFAPQGITSRKIIGRHAWMQLFFHGDLAEMLIYNKALSPEQLAATSAYLAQKYSIPLSMGTDSQTDSSPAIAPAGTR